MKQTSEKIINGHGNNGDWKNKKNYKIMIWNIERKELQKFCSRHKVNVQAASKLQHWYVSTMNSQKERLSWYPGT